MTYRLYFTNGGEPTATERNELTAAYNAYMRQLDLYPEDEGTHADALIDLLMHFASIQAEDSDYRECDNCGDEVYTLSTRGWCDGCEEEAEHEIRDAFSDEAVGCITPATQTILIRRNYISPGLGIAPEGVTGKPYPNIKIEGE